MPAGARGPPVRRRQRVRQQVSCQHVNTCIEVVDRAGWHYCSCPPGYSSYHNPVTRLASCEDTDECEAGSHTCHPQAHCTNTEGSYTCDCGDRADCSTGRRIWNWFENKEDQSFIWHYTITHSVDIS